MPKVGVEPTWALSPLRPERSASACSATPAHRRYFTLKQGFVNQPCEGATDYQTNDYKTNDYQTKNDFAHSPSHAII